MKISTKGRYGLRAMLDLALNMNGSHVSLYNIAERQNISVNYLEQVFSMLRKSGLVKSVKGAQGGYALTESPAKTRVGAILRSLEGDLSVIDTETEKAAADSNPVQSCIKRQVWDKLNQSIDAVVDSITLQDLIDEYRSTEVHPMFYI